MNKQNLIHTVAICGLIAVSALSFDVAAATPPGGKAYDIWVKPDGDGAYKVNSSVGGGTASNPAKDKAEAIKGICKAANNNDDPLPPGEEANGDTKVHPPKAYTPAVPPSDRNPRGTPEKWASDPSAKLSDCCKKENGKWVPKNNPDAKCTEGIEDAKKDDAKDPLALGL